MRRVVMVLLVLLAAPASAAGAPAFLVSGDFGGGTTLATLNADGSVVATSSSPGGPIAALETCPGGQTALVYTLDSRHVDTLTTVDLTTLEPTAQRPVPGQALTVMECQSADGDQVTLQVAGSAAPHSRLLRVDGEEVTQVARGNFDVADLRGQVAFVGTRRGVRRVDLETGRAVRLVSRPLGGVQVSPDGRLLVGVRNTENGSFSEVLDARTGAVQARLRRSFTSATWFTNDRFATIGVRASSIYDATLHRVARTYTPVLSAMAPYGGGLVIYANQTLRFFAPDGTETQKVPVAATASGRLAVIP